MLLENVPKRYLSYHDMKYSNSTILIQHQQNELFLHLRNERMAGKKINLKKQNKLSHVYIRFYGHQTINKQPCCWYYGGKYVNLNVL